jgi:zinc/manganese transport system substrate-binding protein
VVTARSMLIVATMLALTAGGAAAAQDKPAEKIKAVATFSILGDFVANVGGDRVEVSTLVGPNGDAHVYQPSPADAKRLADARIVFTNGLGFEGWMARLIVASGTKASVVVATKGVKPRHMEQADARAHDHATIDPHAWQSVANAKAYVVNIRDALISADPAGRATYEGNATAYLARLDAIDREVRDEIAKIPADRRRIISTHDAFGYFSLAYGLEFIAPLGVSTEAEVSAKDVAKIIQQIRRQKIPAVFLENVSDSRLVKRIAEETGAKIGGTLYSDALTDEKGEAPTYIDMVRHNIRTLSAALVS